MHVEAALLKALCSVAWTKERGSSRRWFIKSKRKLREGGKMIGSFVRGHTGTVLHKLKLGKNFHKKSSSSNPMSEGQATRGEEANGKHYNNSSVANGRNKCWVPHDKTGIYYPSGHDKEMEAIPSTACKDLGINWFSYDDGDNYK